MARPRPPHLARRLIPPLAAIPKAPKRTTRRKAQEEEHEEVSFWRISDDKPSAAAKSKSLARKDKRTYRNPRGNWVNPTKSWPVWRPS